MRRKPSVVEFSFLILHISIMIFTLTICLQGKGDYFLFFEATCVSTILNVFINDLRSPFKTTEIGLIEICLILASLEKIRYVQIIILSIFILTGCICFYDFLKENN